MIQISQAFVDEKFEKFERIRWPNVRYVALMQYDLATKLPKSYLVEPPRFDKLAGKYLSANGCRTFAIT
jgi:2,3-bisphosphoglycerate-independent phosphoglycerate mutase